MEITYDEVINTLDVKYIPTKQLGYSIPPGTYEIIDINFRFKNLLPKELKVDITIDNVKLKSNLKLNQTLIFTEKSLFIHF